MVVFLSLAGFAVTFFFLMNVLDLICALIFCIEICIFYDCSYLLKPKINFAVLRIWILRKNLSIAEDISPFVH